jgi:hypothetical protein
MRASHAASGEDAELSEGAGDGLRRDMNWWRLAARTSLAKFIIPRPFRDAK